MTRKPCNCTAPGFLNCATGEEGQDFISSAAIDVNSARNFPAALVDGKICFTSAAQILKPGRYELALDPARRHDA